MSLISTSRKKTYRGVPRKPKQISTWILLTLLAILIVSFLTGGKSLFNLYGLYRERNELLRDKERLEAENQRLQQEIERLQKDIEEIEKVAREKYNLKRDDEEVYKVTPE